MQLETRNFGLITVKSENVVTFDNGLPGFEHTRRFVLIGESDLHSPFKWLQCIDEPQLAFAVVNPFLIKRDYLFELSDQTVKELGIEKADDVSTFSILVVPEDTSKISMNLKAPVIVNNKNNKAAQIILDTDKYTVRHYILDELRRQEVADNAGTDKEERANDNHK